MNIRSLIARALVLLFAMNVAMYPAASQAADQNPPSAGTTTTAEALVRRALVSNRELAAARLDVTRALATVVGLPANERVVLADSYGEGVVVPTMEDALRLALQQRPDLHAADLNIAAAEAGLRLANAQALPEITLFGGYANGRSGFDRTPVGPLTDRDQLINAGVGISLPVFNRNQGAKAEAAVSIEQAKRLRELTELQIRAEVESAVARYRAAEAAIEVFRQGVIERSEQNVRTIRAAYEAGAFTISEFLAERRRFVDAQRELTEALTERAVALIDLQAAVAEPIEMNEESK